VKYFVSFKEKIAQLRTSQTIENNRICLIKLQKFVCKQSQGYSEQAPTVDHRLIIVLSWI